MRDFAPLDQHKVNRLFFWFLRKATAETRAPILTQNTSNDAVPRKEVPFGIDKRSGYCQWKLPVSQVPDSWELPVEMIMGSNDALAGSFYPDSVPAISNM